MHFQKEEEKFNTIQKGRQKSAFLNVINGKKENKKIKDNY